MFELDSAVLQWRQRQERESPLSPRELDELEDHLRARFDLELELNATVAPDQAFAIARRNLGEPVPLSKEFAKAGKPKWRRWLATGWAMYFAAWFLPVADVPFFGTIYAYELPAELVGDVPAKVLFFLSNLAMVMTVPLLWSGRISRSPWLRRLVSAVGVSAFVWVVGGMIYGSIESGGVGWLWPPIFAAGFWSWSASFLFVAHALRLRATNWDSAAPCAMQPRVSGSRIERGALQ